MKNLRSYLNNTFEFYESVVERKRDRLLKRRLDAYKEDIRLLYNEYDSHFSRNSLLQLNCRGYENPEKADLHSLYAYRSKMMQELKVTLTTTEKGRVMNTCQNCTINEVGSFDHLVPKEEFVEFAVNPKNLFPSCKDCNGFKSDSWRENGGAIFLNLYLDNLPDVQYLFVELDINTTSIGTRYYLYNENNIDNNLFRLLESHYRRLHLFTRFSLNSDTVITNLENVIRSFRGSLSLDLIRDNVRETCQANKITFGHNYWISVLELALIDNPDFMQRF